VTSRRWRTVSGSATARIAPRRQAHRFLANTATGDPLTTWCCATCDIERVARKLGLALERGRRDRPDGSRLSWRVAGREAAFGARPFFIAWDDPAMRPGLLTAPHADEVRGIREIEVACEADQLDGWVDADVPVRRLDGDGGCARS
jgi:hypothetical protein